MSKQAGIYKITNLTDGKFYIGSAVHFARRFYGHRNRLDSDLHRNRHLQSSWNKYGKDAFEFSILEIVEDKKNLLSIEQKWIDETGAVLFGYNICGIASSRLGVKASEETKAKMRASALGKTHSEEAKAKMSKSKTGLKMPPSTEVSRLNRSRARKGKPISEYRMWLLAEARKKIPPCSVETRKKMSDALKGRKLSEAHKQILIDLNKNRIWTEEAREKVSKANKGKKASEETKAKMSKSMKAKKIQLNENQLKALDEGRRKRVWTKEMRKRRSEIAKNAPPQSEETRLKRSESMKRTIAIKKAKLLAEKAK